MKYLRSLATAALAAGLSTAALAADIPTKKAPPPVVPPAFFIFSDTSLSYHYEWTAREPGIRGAIQKNVISLTHVDAWQYGSNFVNIDFLKSNSKDPAAGPAGTTDGAFEVYALFRSTLSLNAISNSKAFSLGGLIKDVAIEYGADANTKNTAFAPQKRDVVIGPQIQFNVPGFLNVGFLYYKEWNHNGLTIPSLSNPSFKPAFMLDVSYLFPLTFTGLPLTFNGYFDYVTPKGRDGFLTQTAAEIHTENHLTLDLGQVVASKPKMVDLWVGHRYWKNKFGNNNNIIPNKDAIENQFLVGLTWHMF